ncbi:ectoine/hydroxyectoine ABC transporter permease subunit EhuC [Microbacterium halotolerans]|uniref:ectoine/hydroxyectoine ABC transporter permease subunit EhuC n=1 Tax=Microbacterium halotolerans TaxID=246613 RepID=UPI000E6AB9B6|nr:ectoine/hydroxyectoine ABC transporter permease subunit EhuC [Microbacterium halotolerans]
MSDDLQTLVDRLPELGSSVLVTLEMTLGGAALAIIVAVLLGFGSRTRSLWVRGPSRVIVEFFRGTSLVVQFFWIFYVLPQLGYKLEPLLVAIIALGLNYGAYAAEVVRGSIASVSTSQWEATKALNMSWFHSVRRVIFPQAWALMIPMLANLLIQLLKGSALAYYITLYDVNWWTSELRKDTADTFFSYTAGLLVYFVIAYALTWGMNVLEERAKRRLGRGTRPTLRETLGLKPATNPRLANIAGAPAGGGGGA